jgi:hypothetical protein
MNELKEDYTRLEIKMYLSDEKLIAELYAISAMLEGMERASYQPEFNKRKFKKNVATEIQNMIIEITTKLEFKINKKNQNRIIK